MEAEMIVLISDIEHITMMHRAQNRHEQASPTVTETDENQIETNRKCFV